MKFSILTAYFFLALIGWLNSAHAGDSQGQCNVGPLNKIYGNVPWLVYSCTTDKNVVIVSAPESPALPFVFCFCMKDGAYQLFGEGTGNKDVTDAAASELSKFNEADIAQLIQQTIQVKAQK